MSPREKRKDIETEVGAEEETVEVSADGRADEAVSAETDVAAETLEEAAEVGATEVEEKPTAEAGTAAEGEERGAKKVNLKTLARNLYEMGLDFGLPPDEAALLTSETKLPAFISKEGVKEFRQGLVEAYQAMLDERLQSLKQQLGVG